MPSDRFPSWRRRTTWAALAGLAVLPGFASAQAATAPPSLPPGVKPPERTPTQETAQPDPTKGKKKPSVWEFVQREVVKKIQLSGSRRIAYHTHRVEGDREAFNLNTTYGLGEKRWTDIGSVAVQGRKVLGLFNFDAVIQDNRFRDPQGQKFSLDYQGGGFSVNLGDIQGRLLDTNRFVTFNRTLRGAMAGYQSGPLNVRALFTEARGEARTVTIAGTNTSGPYFLQSNQILRGTERIEVDGEPQEIGRDYIIDYDLGAVTFVNRSTGQAKIIAPTSVIVATYESFGFSGSKGRVLGAGLTYDLGRLGRFGLQAATQRAGGEGRLSTRLESFQGFGAPGTPYFLQFEPLTGEPIVIRVDGVLQAEGTDYTIDPVNRSIFYFTRFVPSTSTIDVVYTPRPTATVNGDRQILGIDYRLPLGQGATLTLAQASSRLTNTPTPRSGVARLAELRMDRGLWSGYAATRSVPSDYAGIETIGFNRNERTSDAQVKYQIKPGFSTTARWQNAAISQISFDASGNERITPTRFTLSQLGFDFAPQKSGNPWTLNHARVGGRSLSGESQTDTTTLSTSRRWGRLDTRWELSSLLGIAPGATAGEPRQKLARQGLDLRGTYRAGETVSANFSAGLSRISLEDETGLGRDLQLGAAWRPRQGQSVNLTYTDTDSGRVNAVAGFSGGYGLGYGGNGFSSGPGGSPIIGVASLRRLALTSALRMGDQLTLGLSASQARTKGSISSNTETSSLGLSADWEAQPWLQLTGSAGLNSTRYLESGISSRALSWSFFADGAPPGRLSFGVGATGLLGSGSEFSQNLVQVDGRLGYLLASRHRLVGSLAVSRSTGYLPQDDYDFSLGYRYEIWNGLALGVNHRWRRVTNRDGGASGAYTSRGFDLELGFTFGR